ncbi:hypothetical protein FGB62_28g113 [Gracilaria domingensis]|nr:hypothetical protein FGB62_28g113 [Gracilaria domingensis]
MGRARPARALRALYPRNPFRARAQGIGRYRPPVGASLPHSDGKRRHDWDAEGPHSPENPPQALTQVYQKKSRREREIESRAPFIPNLKTPESHGALEFKESDDVMVRNHVPDLALLAHTICTQGEWAKG